MFEWPGMLGPIPLLGDNADGVGVLNTNRNPRCCT